MLQIMGSHWYREWWRREWWLGTAIGITDNSNYQHGMGDITNATTFPINNFELERL